MHTPCSRSWRCTTLLLTGLSVIVAACSGPLENLSPDAYLTGFVVRRVSGRQGLISGDVTFPLVRLQVEKSITEKLDAYARFDFINGQVGITEGTVDRRARGDMQSFGLGVSYAPFCKYLSFDLGGEVMHTDFAVISELGQLRTRISDTAYAWALNVGATARWPLSRRLDFVAAGGYAESDNTSDNVDLEFDGFYWLLGVRLKVPPSSRH